jgi:hypothetical protein
MKDRVGANRESLRCFLLYRGMFWALISLKAGVARMDSQRRKSLLQSLALFTVALLLSSCGGTKENLGPPSIPQDLKYERIILRLLRS